MLRVTCVLCSRGKHMSVVRKVFHSVSGAHIYIHCFAFHHLLLNGYNA